MITKKEQQARLNNGDKVICDSCTRPIEKAEDAYVEILHKEEEDKQPSQTEPFSLLEFSYLCHKPDKGPHSRRTGIGSRDGRDHYKENCMMGTSLEDAYPPYGNLTHIVFPLETVQNYEDDSITWVMDGAFEVIYRLDQKGLPAWDKFIKDISLLLPLYDPPLS